MDERGQPLRPSLEEEGEDHGLEISRLLYDLEKRAHQVQEAPDQPDLPERDVSADATHRTSAPTSDRDLPPLVLQESHQDDGPATNLSGHETVGNPTETPERGVAVEQVEPLLELLSRADVLGDPTRAQLETEEGGEKRSIWTIGLDEEFALSDFRALAGSQEQPGHPGAESEHDNKNNDNNQQQRQQEEDSGGGGNSMLDSVPLSDQGRMTTATTTTTTTTAMTATAVSAVSPFYKPASIVQNTARARRRRSRERRAHAAPQRLDTLPEDDEEWQLQMSLVNARFQLEDSLSTRMARLSRSNAARTTAAASPSLEPQRRSGSIDQGIKLRAGTAVLNRQEVAREAGEPEEATLGVYNFYLVERAYSVRDYINSRLAPIAYSCLSKGALNKQFCHTHKMLISPDNSKGEKNLFQVYVEASFKAAVLKSCASKSVLRELESQIDHRDRDMEAASSRQVMSRECPLIDLVREIPKSFCCSSTAGGMQIFFDTLRSKGMTALADEAQQLFDRFSEHRETQTGQPPNIPDESIAHFLIHGLTEGASLVCSIKAMIAASECGTVEQYITCCQALQEFIDLFICAGWALQTKQKILPIQIHDTSDLDSPATF